MKHMTAKSMATIGLGIGYILGSRAGRGPYQKMKGAASKVRHDPHVQETMHTFEEVAKAKVQAPSETVKRATRDAAESLKEKIGKDQEWSGESGGGADKLR